MLGNDTMETASSEVTSIRRRNDIEKSTRMTHRYFFDFESQIHVEISTSNWCSNFHLDSPFKTDVILTKLPRGISTSNRWRIDEDVSIGSRSQMFFKIGVPKNFANFTGKQLYWSFFLIKLQAHTGVFLWNLWTF